MRISDWSSDVCSSDLGNDDAHNIPFGRHAGAGRLSEPDAPDAAHPAVAVANTAAAGDIVEAVRAHASDDTDRALRPNRGGKAVTARDEELGRASWREIVCPSVTITVVVATFTQHRPLPQIHTTDL